MCSSLRPSGVEEVAPQDMHPLLASGCSKPILTSGRPEKLGLNEGFKGVIKGSPSRTLGEFAEWEGLERAGSLASEIKAMCVVDGWRLCLGDPLGLRSSAVVV